MQNPPRQSKTPLPPVQSTAGLDTVRGMVDSPLEEQVGGGCRPPSPPMETPTRLRTHIKPSERARDNVLVRQAGLRRALMGEVTKGNLLQLPVSSATDDANTAPSPSSAIFMGSWPPNSYYSTPANSASDTLTLSGPVTVPLNDPAMCSDLQMVPTMHVIPPTPIPGQNTIDNALSSSPTSAGPSTPTSGRRTAVINAILMAGYDELKAVLIRLIEQTNLTVQQVLDGWHKSRSRTINGINHWNQYTKYALRHEEQERRQLGLPQDVPRKFLTHDPAFCC